MGGGLQVYNTAARVRRSQDFRKDSPVEHAMAEIITSGTEAIIKPEFTSLSKPKETHEITNLAQS